MASVGQTIQAELKRIVEDQLASRYGVECSLNDQLGRCISEGLGSVCQVFQVQLTWLHDARENVAHLPASVAFKLPRLGEKSVLMCKIENALTEDGAESFGTFFVKLFHDNEVNLYLMFTNDVVAKPIPIPHCYYAGKTNSSLGGVIVMEDMTWTSAIIEDISCGMGTEQVFNVCNALADLHCWCWSTKVDWKGKFHPLFNDRPALDQKVFIQAGLKRLKSDYPSHFDHFDEEAILNFQIDQWPTVVQIAGGQLPTVLKHGDLWTNNILFNRRADGTAGDKLVAIIDWQLAEPGSPVEDLCHLLVWSTSSSFRRRYQKIVLKHYHNRLIENLKGTMAVPDFGAFWTVYKMQFPFRTFAMAIFFHALVGTVIKCQVDNGQPRLDEMVERLLAAYEDAMIFLNEQQSH